MKRGNKLWKRVLTAALSLAVAGACLPFGALAEGTETNPETKTAYYYALVPGGNPNSQDTSSWIYLDTGTFVPNTAVMALKKSEYTTNLEGITYPNSPDDNIIQEKLATYYAESLGDTTIQASNVTVTCKPYKVSYSYGYNVGDENYDSDTLCYHVDMKVDVTLPNHASVAFYIKDLDNDSYGEPKYTDLVEKGSQVSVPDSIVTTEKTVNGVTYIFDGWYTNADCTEKAEFPYTVNSAANFYGYYKQKLPDMTASVTGYTGVYDGEKHTVTVKAPENSTISYKVNEEDDWSEIAPGFVDVGEYPVQVKVENSSYQDYIAEATVTITQRPVTYTAVSVEKVYDGTALGCAASATLTEGELASGDKLMGLSVSGSQQEVGSSPNYLNSITIKNSAGADVTANYAVTLVNGTLTITAAPATPAPDTATPAPTPKDEHPEIAQAIKDGTWGKADPTPTPSADPAVKTTAARVPQTGDTSNPVLWVVVMVMALAAFAGVVILRRRSNKD